MKKIVLSLFALTTINGVVANNDVPPITNNEDQTNTTEIRRAPRRSNPLYFNYDNQILTISSWLFYENTIIRITSQEGVIFYYGTADFSDGEESINIELKSGTYNIEVMNEDCSLTTYLILS